MHPAIKQLRRKLVYRGLSGAISMARALPDAVAFGILPRFGEPIVRQVCGNATIADNLRRAFGGERSEAGIRHLVADYHRHVCHRLVETIRLGGWSRERVLETTEVVGLRYLEAARAEGKGVIIIGGHVGNWEIAGAALARRGLPIWAVGRVQRYGELQAYLAAMRQEHGVGIIPTDSPRRCYRCLREQGLLALLIDVNPRAGGLVVPFFGHPAACAPGPAVLALKTGAPVITMSAQRLRERARYGHGYRHRVVIEPPLPISPTGDQERDVVDHTARFQRALEAAIRRAPEQWIWLYPRWELRSAPSRPEPGRTGCMPGRA